MLTIDLSVKNTALPISVQIKSEEEAEATYQEILTAMRSGRTDILELKSEGKVEKKVAVRISEISGVQLSQKEGTVAGGGRPPGFFALAAE
ncbi:MAG: hypothetical protein PUP91_38595 [Rhizonema sp. PD37]|nr:hypothetical protein [Rhizonema sp. PD37]